MNETESTYEIEQADRVDVHESTVSIEIHRAKKGTDEPDGDQDEKFCGERRG